MNRNLDAARRTELEFVVFRWLAVLYGAIETGLGVRDITKVPTGVVPLAFVLTGGLAISNVAIWSAARRAEDRRQFAVIGAVAFVLDIVVVLAMTWAFTNGPLDIAWLIGYVLPLEGAARYGRSGAIAAAIAFTASVFLRELYLTAQFPPYRFSLESVEFRCAMAFVIALTAGTFARSLHLQTERANERAREAEAATEREAAARARLQELDNLKSDFIAITSHELRTPVAGGRSPDPRVGGGCRRANPQWFRHRDGRGWIADPGTRSPWMSSHDRFRPPALGPDADESPGQRAEVLPTRGSGGTRCRTGRGG